MPVNLMTRVKIPRRRMATVSEMMIAARDMTLLYVKFQQILMEVTG